MTVIERSPNRDSLVQTARLLTPLLAELVFVGGQVAELLVTDAAAVRVRPTDDVDVVVRGTTRGAYHDAAPWADGILEGNLPDTRRVPGLVDAVTRRFQQLAAMDSTTHVRSS